MKLSSKISTLFFLLVTGSAAILAQAVRTDYDHNTNFENHHTYYWQNVRTDDPLWQLRISVAVDQALQARGWRKVESNGDVSVAALGAVHNRQYQTLYDGPIAAVVVDLYDARTKQLIWHSSASDSDSSKPEKDENNLEKAIDMMFRDFPPK